MADKTPTMESLLAGLDRANAKMDVIGGRLVAMERRGPVARSDEDRPPSNVVSEIVEAVMARLRAEGTLHPAAEDDDVEDGVPDTKPPASANNPAPLPTPNDEGRPTPTAADTGNLKMRRDASRRMRLSETQARYDSLSNAWGQQAPRPMDGERPRSYAERLLRPWLKYSSDWKNADLARLDDATFDNVERQVMSEATAAARHPVVPDGVLHQRVRKDDGGRRIIEFFGSPRIWMEQAGARPGRYVTKIMTPPELRAQAMFGRLLDTPQQA
jgi:hypothetical protein